MSNNERGFTLVEAIVAMVVCTIGLVAMAELMAVTLRLQQLGRNSTSAVRLAQDRVDMLTMTGFASPSMACGGALDSDVTNYHDTPMQDNGTPDDLSDDTLTKGYKVRWMVAEGPDGDLNLRMVAVRVIPDVSDRRTASPYDLVTIIRGVAAAC